MEVETPIAESIRIIDKNAQLDAACKRVLAIKIISRDIPPTHTTEEPYFCLHFCYLVI